MQLGVYVLMFVGNVISHLPSLTLADILWQQQSSSSNFPMSSGNNRPYPSWFNKGSGSLQSTFNRGNGARFVSTTSNIVPSFNVSQLDKQQLLSMSYNLDLDNAVQYLHEKIERLASVEERRIRESLAQTILPPRSLTDRIEQWDSNTKQQAQSLMLAVVQQTGTSGNMATIMGQIRNLLDEQIAMLPNSDQQQARRFVSDVLLQSIVTGNMINIGDNRKINKLTTNRIGNSYIKNNVNNNPNYRRIQPNSRRFQQIDKILVAMNFTALESRQLSQLCSTFDLLGVEQLLITKIDQYATREGDKLRFALAARLIPPRPLVDTVRALSAVDRSRIDQLRQKGNTNEAMRLLEARINTSISDRNDRESARDFLYRVIAPSWSIIGGRGGMRAKPSSIMYPNDIFLA